MLKFIKDFRKFQILLIIPIFVLCLETLSLYSSISPTQKIKKIKVKINGVEEENEIRNLILIKEGENFSLKKIRDSIRIIHKTGFYSDIKVTAKGNENIVLIFSLIRSLIIKDINFKGIGSPYLKELKKELRSIQKGDFFTKSKVERAREEIKEFLKSKGFFLCEVSYHFEKKPKKSEIILIFNIKPGNRLIVEKLDFEGVLLFSKETLRNKIKTREGDEYEPGVFKNDIEELRKFYRLKGYYQTAIEISEEKIKIEKREIKIKIKIIPGKKIIFRIRGAKIPLSLLTTLWKEKVFEEWALSEGEAKILFFLRKKGYVFASVKSGIIRKKDSLIVSYEINKGKKYRYGEIFFKGNNYFTNTYLKERFKIKESPFEIWIDGNKLFKLPDEIEKFYRSEGFSDAKVTMNFERIKNRLNILIYVKEGERNIIGALEFKGNKSFSKEVLVEQIDSYQGGPYFKQKVQVDLDKLEMFYLKNGFRGTRIKAEIDEKEKPFIKVSFVISEGERIKIEKIIVVGNLITKKNVILNELKIKEGDFAFYEKIMESKKRLETLGIFSEIKMQEIPLNKGSAVLLIKVREGKRNYIGLGVGILTKREPYSFAVWDFELMPRFTVELSRNNVFGTASFFSFITQIGPWEKRGVISWEQPYFFGLPFKSFLSAWIEEEDRKSFDFNKKGISLTNTKKITNYAILFYRIRWTRTTLFNLEIAESEIDRQHRPFSSSSLSGSIIIDKRDDPFNPERGIFLSFTSELTYPLLGTESKYFKNFLQYQNYIPISSNFIFSITSRLGIAWGNVPISERFFAGGSNSYRGEKFDELGPKDPLSLKPVGGKSLILFNFEIRFPIFSDIKNLSGAIFYDNGNLFSSPDKVNLKSLRNAVGIGIRYKTPLGPVRIDFGMDLAPPDGKRRIIPFLTIGNVF